jgi:putative membrane protein
MNARFTPIQGCPATSPRSRGDRIFFVWNAVVSAMATAFIAFILLRDNSPARTIDLSFIPTLNAVFNALSALCLVTGWLAIRWRAVQLHRLLMFTAFALSAVFLVGYLTYHYVHGDTRYMGTGPMRVAYFTVLVSHIVLSTTVVPGALTSFYFAMSKRFSAHRRLNRVFLPLWLYVSVTGVVIYFMLRASGDS